MFLLIYSQFIAKVLNKRGNIKYQLLELIGENSVYSLYD